MLALAVLATGWWFRGDLASRLFHKPNGPGVASGPGTSYHVPGAVRTRITTRRTSLKEFMVRDLKLTRRQINRYEKYRVYYSNQIQRADRIENRYRTSDVAKLSHERDQILAATVGQRNLDSILWWAQGSRSHVSLDDWLRQRASQRRYASR
jgi:hypothetical protein